MLQKNKNYYLFEIKSSKFEIRTRCSIFKNMAKTLLNIEHIKINNPVTE